MLRKKRVTITEQAQAAIASGTPVETALAEHGTPVPAAETPEVTPEVETPEVTPAAETPEVTPEAETPEVTPAAEAAPVVAPEADDTSAFNSVLDRMQAAQATVTQQAEQITQLQATVEQLQGTQSSLMDIAVAATNRMQIALGGAATDLSHLDATNLLAQYQSTLTTFEKRLPVGGKAEVPVEDENREGKVVPLVSPAVARATQIRK